MENSIISECDHIKIMINALMLEEVSVYNVIENKDHILISIEGGFNGYGSWDIYLTQISLIFNYLSKEYEEVWLEELKSTSIDIWSLKIGVSNKYE